MSDTHEQLLRLASARAEIRAMQIEVQDLPLDVAAPFLYALDWLAAAAERLERQVVRNRRSH